MFLSHYKKSSFLEASVFFCGIEDQTQGIVHTTIYNWTTLTYVILSKSQK